MITIHLVFIFKHFFKKNNGIFDFYFLVLAPWKKIIAIIILLQFQYFKTQYADIYFFTEKKKPGKIHIG